MKVNKEQLIELYAENIVHSNIGINWQEIFEDEEELLIKMSLLSDIPLFKGNPWLKLSKTSLEKGWKLSDKQLTQIKRNGYLMAKLANYNLPEYDYIFKNK